MAGYQRHDFDTTYVQPQSDGGWGALARGFSNGYSMGKAITKAINQRNVSEANKEYDKAVESANQQTYQTEDAFKGGQPRPETPAAQEANGAKLDGKPTWEDSGRATKMTQSQLEKLSPEGRKYFEDYYAKQEAAGNKAQYRYDAGQREQMIKQAGEVRDKAIKDSMLRWVGQDAYDDYRLRQAQAKKADYESSLIDRRVDFRNKMDLYNSGTPEGNEALLKVAQANGFVDPKAQYDLKNMTMTTMGPNGQPTVTAITPEMVAGVRDKVELKMLRGLYVDDPAQRKAITDMRFADETFDERKLGVALGNRKTVNDMRNDNARVAQGWRGLSLQEKGLNHRMNMDQLNYDLSKSQFDYKKENDAREYDYRAGRDSVADYQFGQKFGLEQDKFQFHKDDAERNFDFKQNEADRNYGLKVDENSRNWIKDNREYGIKQSAEARAQEEHNMKMKAAAAEYAQKYGVQENRVELKDIETGEGKRTVITDKATGAPIGNIDPATGAPYPLGFASLAEYRSVKEQLEEQIGPNGEISENLKNGVYYQGRNYRTVRELKNAINRQYNYIQSQLPKGKRKKMKAIEY